MSKLCLVPVTPTEKMLKAPFDGGLWTPSAIWEKMLSARPKASVPDEMVERALNAQMPGGAPFWVFMPDQKYSDKPSERDFEYMRRAIASALEVEPAAEINRQLQEK